MVKPVYFSLGSNQGDRKENLEKALAMMQEAFGVPYTRCSDIIETQSWGFDSDPFLNCAVLFEIDGPDPYRILDQCKSIEKALGRTECAQYDQEGKRIYKARPIDIDILFVGNDRISSPELTIPHPLVFKRDFVLIPLRQIAEGELKERLLI